MSPSQIYYETVRLALISRRCPDLALFYTISPVMFSLTHESMASRLGLFGPAVCLLLDFQFM